MIPNAQYAAPQTLDDYELIDCYLEHQDRRCFDILYGRYADLVYAKCLSLLKDSQAAEDAAQEIFLKVFLRLSSFQKQAKFSTWIYSVTYNYCIDILRRERRAKWLSNDDMEFEDPSPASKAEAEDFEMELGRVRKIIEELPEMERNLLIMKYEDGLAIKDLCQIFRKNESAIKMRLKRAKDKVRLRYDEIFFFNVLIWMECLKN